MQRVNLKRNKFHGEWNYLIKLNGKQVDTFVYLQCLRLLSLIIGQGIQ